MVNLAVLSTTAAAGFTARKALARRLNALKVEEEDSQPILGFWAGVAIGTISGLWIAYKLAPLWVGGAEEHMISPTTSES